MIYERIDKDNTYYHYAEIKDGKLQYFGDPRHRSDSDSWDRVDKMYMPYFYKHYRPTTLTRQEAEFLHLL